MPTVVEMKEIERVMQRVTADSAPLVRNLLCLAETGHHTAVNELIDAVAFGKKIVSFKSAKALYPYGLVGSFGKISDPVRAFVRDLLASHHLAISSFRPLPTGLSKPPVMYFFNLTSGRH